MGPRLGARGCALLLLCLAALAASGCLVNPKDPLRRQATLLDTQRAYTNMVRWGELDRASIMVRPDEREAFLAGAPDPERMRITDFDYGNVEIDKEGASTIVVTYTGYDPASLLQVAVRETQTWEREGMGNQWRVRSEFEQPR